MPTKMVMRRLTCFLCISSFALLYLASCVDASLVVETSKGKIRGIEEVSLGGKQFYSFLGIPFAKPPLGELRFKDPKEADSWDGTINTTEYPEKCLQILTFSTFMTGLPDLVGKEDCLYLNVFTHKTGNDMKPVMVFIHGGGFLFGSSDAYQPYALMDEDIVLVTIQYRLNILGFLSTGDKLIPGNYGLKDQNFALRWVKQNIAKFGGNPESITVFGESAGAASVHFQLFAPSSKGLFHRAIAQSGSALGPWSINRNPRKTAKEYGDLIGCPLEVGEEYLQCLRSKDEATIAQASLGLLKWSLFPLALTPVIDGEFIPEDTAKMLIEKRYNKVDFISGINRDEGAFIIYAICKDKANYEALAKNFDVNTALSLCIDDERHSTQAATKIYQHYNMSPSTDFASSNDKLIKVFNDGYFKHFHDVTTHLHAKDPHMNVYRYEFHHKGKFSIGDFFPIDEAKNWISHFDEIHYLFEGGEILQRKMEDPEDLRMRKMLLKLWTNFALSGDPTPDDSLGFKWIPTKFQKMNHLKITKEPHIVHEDRTKKVRKFWLSLPLEQNKYLRQEFEKKEEL